MAEVITTAGENRIAQCQGTGTVLVIDRFILSFDPNIDPLAPIDRNTQAPTESMVVFENAVTQQGYVNPNQVVYSLFMDNTVGPFQFNRMDLVESATNTVIAIATSIPQHKVADQSDQGIRGQSMTRNFMLVFDAAATVTQITVEAATWQIDFMARLHASDLITSINAQNIWGFSCFWQTAFQVVADGDGFTLMGGAGYVGGIHIRQHSEQPLTIPSLPMKVWVDVCQRGDLNGIKPEVKLVLSNEAQTPYTDQQGVVHLLECIASVDSNGVVTDRRNAHNISNGLFDYLLHQMRSLIPDMTGHADKVLSNNGQTLQWAPGRYIGEIVRMTTDTAPPGTFALDGSTIPNGKHDFAALANCSSRYVTISGDDLILADCRDFGRGKGSSDRAVGVFEGDAIRNIVGEIYPAGEGSWANGVFKHNKNARTWNSGDYRTTGVYEFNANNVVPTAPENRPKSMTELVCIYHGVL